MQNSLQIFESTSYRIVRIPLRPGEADTDSIFGGVCYKLLRSEDQDEIQELYPIRPAAARYYLARYLRERLGREPTSEDFELFESQNRWQASFDNPVSSNRGGRVTAFYPTEYITNSNLDQDE